MAKKKNITKKPKSKVLRVINIIKNIILGIILALLVGVMIVVITAHFNGETPKVFGHAVYRVSSGSMVPYLQVGDIILCKDCDPMELEVGDIITYNGTVGQFAGKKVTHRVVVAPYLNEENGKYYLVTKGDDNPVEDTPIDVSQVTGKYVKKVELLKKLYDFFLTPWGLLTIIGLIVLAFFNEIINFAKALAGHGDEEEHEDIQDIIERVQRESAEEEKREQEKAQKKQNKKGKKSKNGDKADEKEDDAEVEESAETDQSDEAAETAESGNSIKTEEKAEAGNDESTVNEEADAAEDAKEPESSEADGSTEKTED